MKKGIRRLLIGLGIVAVLAIAVTASILITKSWVGSVTWADPKLDQLADGDYPGEAALSLPPGGAAANPAVKVVVQIRDHKYAGFTIVDPVAVAPTLDEVGKEIIARQSLKLDAIAGPTVTKVAFLSAVANAVGPK